MISVEGDDRLRVAVRALVEVDRAREGFPREAMAGTIGEPSQGQGHFGVAHFALWHRGQTPGASVRGCQMLPQRRQVSVGIRTFGMITT